ncbi:MAG TPA: DUF2779 domain-containing protein [Gemmatimonadales bacterium]|nr:DUF2779 domain-containing protein [Gemmatimonadales bacterium]
MPAPLLSKSRFLTGLQCPKQLWWRVHEPDAPELQPDDNTRILRERGAEVGVAARRHVPGGVLIIGEAREGPQKVARTRKAIEEGATLLYEATFEHQGVIASIDILERTPTGFRLTEVKSTVEVKPEHLPDITVQTWVTRGAGLPVVESHLMHLNRECRAPDLSNLFARADQTAPVSAELPVIPAEAARLLQVIDGPLPEVPIGDHCDTPFECPFKSRCWPVLPEHHIETLPRLSPKKREALKALNIATIEEIPRDFVLTDTQERQRQAVVQGKMLIDPALARVVKTYWGARTAFLDFETVSPAIPIWDGTGPYAQVGAQFSCHVAGARAHGRTDALEHFEWIATTLEDPRLAFAEAVIEACRGCDIIVAFNASFERSRLEALAGALPAHREALMDIVRRIKDLADPIRRGLIYHPNFYGSFSLKKVVPALIPELAYDDLEVADGTTASNQLLALMQGEPPAGTPEAERVTRALLEYCKRDTLVMVRLLEKLGELAAQA